MGSWLSELPINELLTIKSKVNVVLKILNMLEEDYARFNEVHEVFEATARLGNFLTSVNEEIGDKTEAPEINISEQLP